jgi:hypothetical protein
MVDGQVEDNPHSPPVRLIDQSPTISQGAVRDMDILEIGDVIAHIDLRTLIVRTQPYNIHSKISNVVEFRDDARDVADAIVVALFEAGGIDLVDDAFFPPSPFVFWSRYLHS